MTACKITIDRNGIFTGYFFTKWLLTRKGAGRAYLHARRTETAQGFSQCPIDSSDNKSPLFIIDEIEYPDAVHIAAHPYTSCAADAEIEVYVKQMIIFDNRKISKDIPRGLGPEADIVN